MNDVVLSVENISKRYRIGSHGGGHRFSEVLYGLGRAALSLPKRLTARQDAKDATSASNEFWALKDISFQVRQGEVLGIIGRNGAGKSTLLKVLSRVTEPTEGRIGVRGRIGSLLEVGTGFHPELTGRENIYLNGAILGMTHREVQRRFDEIVAFSEVDRFLDTPVKRYSSGMYVRLAFAVAAHLEPEILIVDEVLAVGDSAFQMKCRARMQEAATAGGTVLLVSHNPLAVADLCSRCLLIADGRLEFDGAPAETLSAYRQQVRSASARMAKSSSGPDRGGADVLVLSSPPPHESYQQRPRSHCASLEFDVVFELLRAAEELYVNILLMDDEGSQLLHLRNDFTGKLFRDVAAGKYRCVVNVEDLELDPGRYEYVARVVTIAGSERVQVIHDSPRISFEVIDDPRPDAVPRSSFVLSSCDNDAPSGWPSPDEPLKTKGISMPRDPFVAASGPA